MGLQSDIMLLEASLIKRHMERMSKSDQLESVVMTQSGLTYEQWVNNYAAPFRQKINEVLDKKKKLPTVEEMEAHLYSK
jgi:hypothetical protein